MAKGAAAAAAEASAQPVRRSAPRQRGGIPLFRWLTQNIVWELFIIACIVANAAILGYDAHYGGQSPYSAQIEQWNTYFLYIFTAELFLEFLAQGPKRYFSRGWNWFDIFVVGISYLSFSSLSALRTLRVVRIFRLIGAVPQMRRVVEALFGALPGILAAFAILAVVFYIAAVMGTTLFHNDEAFRDLGTSFLSLFALSQFDGWGDTVARLQTQNPFAWVYVLGFTLLAVFAVLNLFIGVIVEAVQQAPHEEIKDELDELEEDVEDIATAQEDAAAVTRRVLDEVKALRAEVAALRGAPPQA